MSPAVRLRHLYVASGLGLIIFRPLDFVAQGVQNVNNYKTTVYEQKLMAMMFLLFWVSVP
jgi:hypothetical protein